MKKVVLVGVGTVGCFAAEKLAEQKVSLRIIDRDFVDSSNIGVQVLYSKEDLGFPKALAAKKKPSEERL